MWDFFKIKMVNTIDMQDIRQLNLFERMTNVRTRFCFHYNDAIFFCVPRRLIRKAVGENGDNVKNISRIIKKKVKIIPMPDGIKDAKRFIESIVSPVTFKDFQIANDEIVISANRQSKAALIGRNRRRFNEMQKILKNFFGKDLKIV